MTPGIELSARGEPVFPGCDGLRRIPVTKWEETMKRAAKLIVAAALCLAAPVLAQAQNTGGSGLPQFQVDPLWPKHLPNNWLLGQVSGITVDRFDHIWVVQRPGSLSPRERAAEQNPPVSKCCVAAPPVLVFDQSGNLVKTWGGPGQGYQWPESEHGIYIDDNDFVWLAGNGKKDGQLLKFTMDGKFVLQIGKSGEGHDSNSTERLGSPADVAVDVAAKEVYAADGYENRRIVVFDSETGAYKRHWGAYGKKPSDEKLPPYDPAKPASAQFGNPVHCVRIDKDGLVHVCDRTNDRVQVFRKDGTFVSEHFYEKNTRATGSVYELVFSPDKAQKYIYMVDGANGEVRIIDHASKDVLGRFGRVGRQAGEFTAAHNIAVDHQGNIYTAEVATGERIQRFRRLDPQD
jgi:DNA-binding beta-propeller fold protein YncE